MSEGLHPSGYLGRLLDGLDKNYHPVHAFLLLSSKPFLGVSWYANWYVTTRPRNGKNEHYALTDDEAQCLFTEGAPERIPRHLTRSAGVVHRALRKALLPRLGYRERITTLLQHLLRVLVQRVQFCVVDF